MKFHIVNGDCLAAKFQETAIDGQLIVCRECLIEGPLEAHDLEDFWSLRADFITGEYKESREGYFQKVVLEMEKLLDLPEDAGVCLWFEDDLFCQANMWFVLSLLSEHMHGLNLYRIFPVVRNEADLWKGFGLADKGALEEAYANRTEMTKEDIALGTALWKAYTAHDFHQLTILSYAISPAFRYLPEVCKAQIDRFPEDGSSGRPQQVIRELMSSFPGDFNGLFSAFSEREGIYGFGDVQVRRMYDEVNG